MPCPCVVKAVLLTIVEDFCAGAALWIVLNAAGLKIDIVSSTITAYGVVAIAQIPVTIGGAGVTELTMKSYLTTVYNFVTWAPIVLWRIATYQVLLAVTGIVFVFFVRKATSQSRATAQSAGKDPAASANPGMTAAQMVKEDHEGREGGSAVGEPLQHREDIPVRDRWHRGLWGHRARPHHRSTASLWKAEPPHASFASPTLIGLDVLSLVIGVSASFFINERITVIVPKAVKGQEGTILKRFVKFQAVSGIGNTGIVIVQLVFLALLGVTPLIGSIIGAIATYPIVYFISIKYVWKAHRTR